MNNRIHDAATAGTATVDAANPAGPAGPATSAPSFVATYFADSDSDPVDDLVMDKQQFKVRAVGYDEGINRIQRLAREGGLIWEDERFFDNGDLAVEHCPLSFTQVENSGELVVGTPYAAQMSAMLAAVVELLGSDVSRWEDNVLLPDVMRAFGRASQGGATVSECVAAGLEPLRRYVHEADREYFAYGSNMDVRQMARRCPDARLQGRAVLRDFRLVADEAGFLSIERCPGDAVEGLLWEVSLADVDSLDRYEGVASGCYRKDHVTVKARGRRWLQEPLVYISERPTVAHSCNRSYMERVIDAAQEAGMHPETLARLEGLAGLE